MSSGTKWTNDSVLALARGDDPVEAVTRRARQETVRAIDAGWEGPPFDPLELADRLGLQSSPNDEVRDARVVPSGSKFRIEFNPNRSRRRVRYSIAHEIAHTLFPDCAKEVRHRQAGEERGTGDEWQLEALCNVAAAEFLMPIGTLPALGPTDINLDRFLELREDFDVSTEALFIRLVRVTDEPCAMFCASRIRGTGASARYRVDYLIGSRTWPFPRATGMPPRECIASHCTSVGFSWKGEEMWRPPGRRLRVEAVGIPPYPGSSFPRVVGLARTSARAPRDRSPIQAVFGDATSPSGPGPKLIAHVVNDKTPNWGGRGFALALANRYQEVRDDFRTWADSRRLRLGSVRFCQVSEDLYTASMVAQHGYGPSPKPRIRYEALRGCLQTVADLAQKAGLSVHMPRIGCGEAGGSWQVVRELIHEAVSSAGIPVTVYDLPGAAFRPTGQASFSFGRR